MHVQNDSVREEKEIKNKKSSERVGQRGKKQVK